MVAGVRLHLLGPTGGVMRGCVWVHLVPLIGHIQGQVEGWHLGVSGAQGWWPRKGRWCFSSFQKPQNTKYYLSCCTLHSFCLQSAPALTI